ncbi:MAG: nuclear transport factor 2 family protein [bacterium]
MAHNEQVLRFAQGWIDAWNSHDVDRILEFYAEDFELTTPYAVTLLNIRTGTLKGKDTIRTFMQKAFRLIPQLRYELLEVLSSVSSISIYHNSILGKRSVEVLFFDANGKINKSISHYNSL